MRPAFLVLLAVVTVGGASALLLRQDFCRRPGRAGPAAGGAGRDAWVAPNRPYCNPLEIDGRLRADPPPAGFDGTAQLAACYGMAGKIDEARRAVQSLPLSQWARASAVVFEVAHPIADAGDDRSAGPLMRLVLEFWPQNYMALYHAGMAEALLGQDDEARGHLERFLELYTADDGWTRRARAALAALARPLEDRKREAGSEGSAVY